MRVSKGAQRRGTAKAMDRLLGVYHFADYKTQEELLRRFFNELKAPPAVKQASYERALRALGKRLERFYGLDNKYDGKGNKREA